MKPVLTIPRATNKGITMPLTPINSNISGQKRSRLLKFSCIFQIQEGGYYQLTRYNGKPEKSGTDRSKNPPPPHLIRTKCAAREREN